eukprot:TRINITY_DN6592_c0_g1_i2.p1 TRINITY_DN6592_c0_g1~~TRINITY_DN6592_c0_g1_i2.p1  ORF type:complete len:149 (+),score=42.81 TRINITY_DN6592_c0_g1_i2:477-923(+)
MERPAALRLLLSVTLLVSFVVAEVVELDDNNYDIALGDPSKVFFVKFFTPWCGHCKRLAPTWEELGAKVERKDITISRVDCTASKELCGKKEIRGYPTLKVFFKGEEVSRYSGPRDVESLHTFIVEAADAALAGVTPASATDDGAIAA